MDQAAGLAAIDRLIAHHSKIVETLLEARKMLAPSDQPVVPEKMLQLAAPSRKVKKRAGSDEPVIHEIEGVDVEVSPLQSEILDALSAAPQAIQASDIAQQIGHITPNGVLYAIRDLRERFAKCGCKAEINGYRGRGFILEMDRGA